ncbi:MAG: glycosyltransferase [Chthoniobacterales bacterium]
MPESTSILIVTCNRRAALRQTLDDILKQTQYPDEIIVIDQSRDDSGNPVDPSDALKDVPQLRYIYQTVQNAEVARNRAIREAVGSLLIMVDDDVRLPITFVESHVKNYHAPEIDAIAGQVLRPNQKPTDQTSKEFEWQPDGWTFFPLHFSQRCRAINWPSCNGSIRREVAIAAGGFDEQFSRTWFDDTDFSWRLKQIGAHVVFDPEASAVHLKVSSGGKRPEGKNALILADKNYWATLLYFWRKNFGLLSVRKHFSRYLIRTFFRKAFFLHPFQFLTGVGELIAGYRISSEKLRQGPIYPWNPQSLNKEHVCAS